MQAFIELLRNVPGWVFTLVLGAVLGGVSWYVHRRSGDAPKPGSPAIDLLEGAIAGVVALGVLRPADILGQIATALVAGYSASAYLAKQSEALVNKNKDEATTEVLQMADSIKQAKTGALLEMLKAEPDIKVAPTMLQQGGADEEIDRIIRDSLTKIEHARTASEVRMLKGDAITALKRFTRPAA